MKGNNMALDHIPIESITEKHLRDLIDNKVPEGKTIDYKQMLKLHTPSEKKAFLNDISAFANTLGGYIVYGMKEQKGIPVELCGIDIENQDKERQRLDNLVRDGIEPRIYGIQIQPVVLSKNKYAIVIKVPDSFNPPHMVIIDGHRKFYARNSSGTYPLNVEELRILFGISDTIAKNAREFRYQRLSMIKSGPTPIPLLAGPKYILHLIPFGSFRPSTNYDLSGFHQNPQNLPNICWKVHTGRYNFDGFVSHHGYIDPIKQQPTCSYTQLFRNGIIEAVYMEYNPNMEGHVNRVIDLAYETKIIGSVKEFISVQKQLGTSPPIFVMFAILGVKGIKLAKREYPETPATALSDAISFEQDHLILPEVALSDFEQDIRQQLQPVFDIVLNAAALTRND